MVTAPSMAHCDALTPVLDGMKTRRHIPQYQCLHNSLLRHLISLMQVNIRIIDVLYFVILAS